MDLSFIKEQLETFSTFAGAIGDFLQKPVEFLNGLVDWLNGAEPNPLGNTEKVGDVEQVINSNSSNDWEITKGALSSDSAESGEAKGFSLSSSDKAAE
jgi:hypothetical protein